MNNVREASMRGTRPRRSARHDHHRINHAAN